ncbi:MAG: NAD-dependent epimerase/dehydratase family protein [Solirubrobacterales bacterium]
MKARGATLVTGAGGCIGAWTVRRLIDEGVPVVAFDLRVDARRLALLLGEEELARVTWASGDITDLPALRRTFDEHEIDAVIHLAALQAPFCRADPPRGAEVNVVGTVNLLQVIADRGLPGGPLVYASSVAAADRADGDQPETIYGVYKRACEGAADVFLRERGVSSIGLRPHTVYGPGRDQGLTSAPTVAMLAAATGKPFEIPFGGRLTMQYASDVAAAFISAVRARDYAGAGVFDLAGETVGVDAVVEAITAVVPGAEVTITGPPLPFPPEVDPSPDAPFGRDLAPTPLDAGVRETIERFRSLHERGLVSPPV